MSLPERRRPTLTEAVALVMQSQTREYRQECIRYWREHYGDAYADAVQREVEARWKGRR